MLLGKVIGTVVATQKEAEIRGLRLMLIRGLDADMTATKSLVVAADAVGAGVGEVVLFAQGSSARQTELTHNRPIDAVIMAIVDVLELDGDVRYLKDRDG
jgi:microcompartment protein CcmK/EutM